MKKHLQFLLALVVMGIFGAESLWAYDSHHPNPMSILNGTHRHRPAPRKVKKIRVAPKKKTKKTVKSRIQKGRMYHKHREGKYIIKPEPYSLKSEKSDPELLGPQRTYQDDGNGTSVVADSTSPVATPSVTMTHEACVALIGQEKFDLYVSKYGGESGAIHRCRVLKQLQGS